MTSADRLIARTRVILTAAVTWLVIGGSVLTMLAGELATAGLAPEWTDWLVKVAGWTATAVLIIRRVSPVTETERGVLPK